MRSPGPWLVSKRRMHPMSSRLARTRLFAPGKIDSAPRWAARGLTLEKEEEKRGRANDPRGSAFKPFHEHFRGRHFLPCPTNFRYARFFSPRLPLPASKRLAWRWNGGPPAEIMKEFLAAGDCGWKRPPWRCWSARIAIVRIEKPFARRGLCGTRRVH